MQRSIGVSKLGRNVKAPCFYTQDAERIHVLARLMVSEETFWTELGLALGIKFVGWEKDQDEPAAD